MAKYRKHTEHEGIHKTDLRRVNAELPPVNAAPPPVNAGAGRNEPFSTLKNKGRISQESIDIINNNFEGFYDFKLNQEPKRPGTENILLARRTPFEKALFNFTLDTLAKDDLSFGGIQFGNLEARGQIARGYVGNPNNTMYLNSNIKYQPDIVHTIIHEGNHVIEYNDPRVAKATKDFLIKKANLKDDKKLPAGYVPSLFEGMQDIIRFPDAWFKNLYKADNPPQQQEIKLSDLTDTPLNPWAHNFIEIPAFALEGKARNIPFNINDKSNDDSRSLLKRILKDLHRQYDAHGLTNHPDGHVYKRLSEVLKKRVAELRNKTKYETEADYLQAKGDTMRAGYIPSYNVAGAHVMSK